jgi:DNA-binding response OmpR family regulator
MSADTEKLLIVESDDALKQSIVQILKHGGYSVSTDYGEGMKSVLAFNPDVVILGADPPQHFVVIFFLKSIPKLAAIHKIV